MYVDDHIERLDRTIGALLRIRALLEGRKKMRRVK